LRNIIDRLETAFADISELLQLLGRHPSRKARHKKQKTELQKEDDD
jgi:hypothetical protein